MKKMILMLLAALLCTGAALYGKPQKKTETVTFSVSMDCRNCEKKITENISFEKGVKDLSTDLPSRTVKVEFDPVKTDTLKLAAAIRKLGYKVSVSR